MNHEKFRQEALAEAKKGYLPYGAVIVKDISISCQTIRDKSFQNIDVVGVILADKCLELCKNL